MDAGSPEQSGPHSPTRVGKRLIDRTNSAALRSGMIATALFAVPNRFALVAPLHRSQDLGVMGMLLLSLSLNLGVLLCLGECFDGLRCDRRSFEMSRAVMRLGKYENP
jgi:hypothetical protein